VVIHDLPAMTKDFSDIKADSEAETVLQSATVTRFGASVRGIEVISNSTP